MIAGNWANDRCTDCHDTGAATTHDGYVTAHTVSTTRGCANSGSSCHGTTTNLAVLHNASQSGGAPDDASCANAGCHTSLNARPAAIAADSCGHRLDAAATSDKTTTNHGGKHDFDIVTNNYSTSRTPAARTPAPAATGRTRTAQRALATSSPTTRPGMRRA